MESQRFCHFFFTLTWMFFLPSVCSGKVAPTLSLESTSGLVFVAFVGEDLTIECVIKSPQNESGHLLTCFDPSHNQIYKIPISLKAGHTKKLKLQPRNLVHSGNYYCQYQSAKMYWFLLLREDGYKEPVLSEYTEFIVVAVFTGVLLVFSVVGSVYVFRGDWKEQITKCGETGGKRKQNREETKASVAEEDNRDITAPSTSFYASLGPRPRSIYDVLELSAANIEPAESKVQPKRNESKKTTEQTTHHPNEGVFESVYENF